MATAAHMLGIWRHRRDRLRRNLTNEWPDIRQFCEDFVRELEALDPTVEIKRVGRGSSGTDFVAAGKVLATRPAYEDPKWWREGEYP